MVTILITLLLLVIKYILLITDFSLRGVRAISAIAPSDIVMTVPTDSALIVTNNRQPTPFPEFVSPEIWGESLWYYNFFLDINIYIHDMKGFTCTFSSPYRYHRLAFKLLYDMKNDNGPLSWKSQLPTRSAYIYDETYSA